MIRITAQFLLTVCLATPVFAGVYWVSPDGESTWETAQSTMPLSGKAACSLSSANANAAAGDTVYLRGGNYAGQDIRPMNSGTSDDQRITFSSHKGEKVLFEESDGIFIDQKSYISVTGMEFRQMKLFFRIAAGHHNTISHCLFDGRSNDSQAWVGARIGAILGNRNVKPSTHNWVHHCQFYRFVYKGELPNRGALLDIGTVTGPSREDNSTHNRIEHNILAYGGHHTLGVYSKYNVIRFNYTHNETNRDNWEFPGYRGAVTQGTSGGHCLYEGNRFGFSDKAGIGLRSPSNIFRRNQFYQNGSGGIQVVTNNLEQDRADDNYVYHNTFFHNGHRDEYPGFQGGMYFASWSGVSPKRNVVKNNLFYDNKNGAISYERPADPQTIENNWDNDNDPKFIDATNKDPNVADRPDLHLAPDSPAEDRAGWLTSITSKSSRGTTFQVADAGYFMDGWGIIEGDRIQLQGQKLAVAVTSVDNQTITVDRELSYETGQGVALAYSGNAPEPGAFEIPASP